MIRIPNNLTMERCQCGHLRGQHRTIIAENHGPCAVKRCQCEYFTWKSEPTGGYKYDGEAS